MAPTHFLSLPDIVLLEMFSYLSCEDILYAFANLHDLHLIDLLTEYGAFRHICLSSQISRHQYQVLSKGIWRYDSVRSFVCKEMFSDFTTNFTPCQIFSSLTELRILFLRYSSEYLSDFVIAHSSTLTHLTVTRSEQAYYLDKYKTFLYTILPHLSRLTLLDTDLRSRASIQWNRLADCLQLLQYLFTYVESMSDIYALATDGFLPSLRFLRVYVKNAVIKAVSSEVPTKESLHMPKLETLDLYLKGREEEEEEEEEEQVDWAVVERLTSPSIMPRLRRYSLIYSLSTAAEIQYIFQSSLFQDDERHIRIRFALYIDTLTSKDSSDNITNICDIRSTRYDKIFVQYDNEDKSELHCTWFTSTWPSWTIFWMNCYDIAPRSGVLHLGIEDPNILLHSIGKLFPDANELTCQYPASISIVDLSIVPTPLINVRHLTVLDVVPGLELLLDGIMLPRLRSLCGMTVPLFVGFACRANQMKTLDTVDQLVITDQRDNAEICFSFKQWHIILDALPRLRTLLVQFHNPKCPPLAIADLFVDYIKRTNRAPLILFSCCMHDRNDTDNKEQFIIYLAKRIEMVCSPVQLACVGLTRLDAWM